MTCTYVLPWFLPPAADASLVGCARRDLTLFPAPPLRPCIRALPCGGRPSWACRRRGVGPCAAAVGGGKRVVFADSRGLSLTAVRVFTHHQDDHHHPRPHNAFLPALPLPRLRRVNSVCVDRTASPGPAPSPAPSPASRLRLDFPQPLADYPAFVSGLRANMVALETCVVTDRALQGTVRVRNLRYEKAVHLRVTFDSWRSRQDVPCAYLARANAEQDTDLFEFRVPVPGRLDPQDRVEFCVRYLPAGYAAPLWDNNQGKNYSVSVSAALEDSG